MSVKQRLVSFIKTKNLSQSKFEKQVGVSNSYVNNISFSIGAEKLQKILCVFPDLNSSWLLTGDGEMLRSDGQMVATAEGEYSITKVYERPQEGRCPACDDKERLIKALNDNIGVLQASLVDKNQIIKMLQTKVSFYEANQNALSTEI